MKKFKIAVLSMISTMLFNGTVFAEVNNSVPPTPPTPQVSNTNEKVPASLEADEVVYDMRTGVMTASGNVLMLRGTAKLTGRVAEFNTKTKAGSVVGDVIAVDQGMRLTADRCISDGNHIFAEGEVVRAVKDDKTFTGSRVDYFQEDSYVLLENGGLITSEAGDSFSADRMEGWLKMNYAKGTGNAHLISTKNDLEAAGDVVDYYGKVEGSEEPGKAYLTGNAWAVQDNNTLQSNRLVLYLADEKKSSDEEIAVSEADK